LAASTDAKIGRLLLWTQALPPRRRFRSEGTAPNNFMHTRHTLTAIIAIALLTLASPRLRADQVRSQNLLADALAVANRIDDGQVKAQTQDLIATAQAQTGDIASVLQTADAMRVDVSADSQTTETESGWRLDAYAAIAGARAGLGDTPGAVAAASAIEDSSAKSMAFQHIVEALAARGDINGALNYCSRTSQIYRTRSYAAVAKAQAAAGNIAAAARTAANLDNSSEQALTFIAVAQAQIKSGDSSGARSTLEQARAATDQIPGHLSRSVYGAIARAEVKAGNQPAADDLRKIDASYIASQIAVAHAQMGDISAAWATAAEVANQFDQAWADSSIAEALAKSDDFSDAATALNAAREALSLITDTTNAADACGRIAEAWTRCGGPSHAADWVHSQQDPNAEISGLISIARALSSANSSTEQ
jgi:hypothetical protein